MGYSGKVLCASPQMTKIPQRSLLEQFVSAPTPLATSSRSHSYLTSGPPQAQNSKPRIHPFSEDKPVGAQLTLTRNAEAPKNDFGYAAVTYFNRLTKGYDLVQKDPESIWSSIFGVPDYGKAISLYMSKLREKKPDGP